MAVVAMLLAGLSFTSCDENDNAVIINGKEWVKAEVIKTDGGATIVANTPSDVNRMLMKIAVDLNDAVQAGEDYVITIETPSLEASESDNTISIPLYDYLTADPTSTAKVVVNFTNAFSTADEPIKIQAKGATGGAVAAENKVELNIPSSASGIDLELYMPTSTVTLNAGTIDELVAIVATSTLIIEKGVTVNWLQMKGGKAVVKEGGKVIGYIRNGDEEEENNYDAEVTKEGVKPCTRVIGTLNPGVPYWDDEVVDENDDPYYAQKLKIVKGEAALANVYVHNGLAKDALEMYIDDGAAVAFEWGWEYDSEAKKSIEPNVKFIQGLGNKTAKIYPIDIAQYTENVPITDKEGNPVYEGYITFPGVKELKNVTVDATVRPEFYNYNNSGEYKDYVIRKGEIYNLPISSTDCDFISPERIYGQVKNNEMSKVTNCTLTCPTKDEEDFYTYPQIYQINAINSKLTALNISNISPSSENSTFKGKRISFTNYYVSGNSATIKSCKFETADENNDATVMLPYQTASRSSFNFTFDTCDFEKGFLFAVDYENEKPWYDKDGKLVTKGYVWWELDENGDYKLDEYYSYIQKRSANESDIPAANKANGQSWDWPTKGYRVEEDPNGFREDAYYKDYKGIITFENTKLGGKAITKDTEFIWNVNSGYNEKGEIATVTRFVIGGVSYKAVRDTDTQDWILVAAE